MPRLLIWNNCSIFVCLVWNNVMYIFYQFQMCIFELVGKLKFERHLLWQSLKQPWLNLGLLVYKWNSAYHLCDYEKYSWTVIRTPKRYEYMCQGLHRPRKPPPPPGQPPARHHTCQSTQRPTAAVRTRHKIGLKGALPRRPYKESCLESKVATAGNRSLRMMETLGYGPKWKSACPPDTSDAT